MVSTSSTGRGVSTGSIQRSTSSTGRAGRGKLQLDPVTVRKARTLARRVGKPVVEQPRDQLAAAALRDAEAAAEVGRDAEGGGSGRLVLGDAERGSGHAGADPAGRLVDPRPRVEVVGA